MNDDVVERVALQLWQECKCWGWGSNPTTDGMTWDEFKVSDPIGASEFGGVAERLARAALDEPVELGRAK